MAAHGLAEGAKITLETISTDGIVRRVEGLTAIDYPCLLYTSRCV